MTKHRVRGERERKTGKKERTACRSCKHHMWGVLRIAIINPVEHPDDSILNNANQTEEESPIS